MNYNFPFDNLVLGQVLFFGKSLQRAIFFSKFKQGVSGCFFCGYVFGGFFVFLFFLHIWLAAYRSSFKHDYGYCLWRSF